MGLIDLGSQDRSDETASSNLRSATATSDVEHASAWLKAFERALSASDRRALDGLFVEDAHWRDLFIFTWTITPRDGRGMVVSSLLAKLIPAGARGFRLAENHTPPRRVTRTGETVIEAIYQFETNAARGLGVLRLRVDDPERAWILSTTLRELKGYEEPLGERRRDGNDERLFGGLSWNDRRAKEMQYHDRDPAVLIVGGGHNGLSIAAKLRLLNVDTLVVDRLPQVGDNWRRRYNSLALHNRKDLNHLPYMPYPDTWPTYLNKDRLGDWLDAYAKAMDINVWSETEFIHADWDATNETWIAKVKQADGTLRVFRPRHIVMANGGIVGQPRFPEFPGLRDFKGEIIHSHTYTNGAAWKGKKVIIVGVGNTAHDIAQDLHGHEADVTMIQRGSLTVFSVEAASLNHTLYYKEGLPTEDCDLIATSITFPVALKGYQMNVQKMLGIDKALHEGLTARGFKLDIGEDGGGHQMKIRRQHGGYYLNVGCSDLIVNGQIGLLQTSDIETFEAGGLRLRDGSLVPADLVITATGYENPRKALAELFSEGIADKVGPIWGLDDIDRELRNMYKPTPQKGLWFVAGGFAQGRVWTQYIALQIKAREVGLVSDPIPA